MDTKAMESLHHAVKSGNLSLVSALLQKGVGVNIQDNDGNTALHLAALFNQPELWNLLIDYGASITVENSQSLTALAVKWDRKRLDWNTYEVHQGISRGMQESTRVLTKKPGSHWPNAPQYIFEKRYDLAGHSKQDLIDVKTALKRENSIFQRLSHRHIVSYFGCKDIEKDSPRLYLEYFDGGDLRDDMEPDQTPSLLPNAMSKLNFTDYDHGTPQGLTSGEGKRRWSETQVWRLMYQLFSALAHLHYGVSVSSEHEQCVYEPSWDPVIHRDINPRNVVVSKGHDGEWDAKICDLGIARGEIREKMSLAMSRGSIHYQPPELDRMQWSPKGDVWALAKTIQGLRKSFKSIPHPMKQILDDCKNENPHARPSSLAVLEVAHRHVGAKFPSLERELKLAKPKSLIFHAFLTIAKQMDNRVPFETDAAFAKRSGEVHRLGLLLHDGALNEFESSCNDLQLAVLFTEYINTLKEKRRGAEPQSQPPPPTKHQDLLGKLLNQNPNPDEQWPISGWTALHIAAQQGSEGMVQQLLNAKADPSRRDARGWTARQYASRIRTLWEEREMQATSKLAAEKTKPRPDRARVYVLQRQLSSNQSNKKAFEAIEDILWQAEDVEKGGNGTAVKENMRSNADAFKFNRNI